MIALHLGEIMTSFSPHSFSRADEFGKNLELQYLNVSTPLLHFETRSLLGAVLVSAGTCGPVLTVPKEKPKIVNPASC